MALLYSHKYRSYRRGRKLIRVWLAVTIRRRRQRFLAVGIKYADACRLVIGRICTPRWHSFAGRSHLRGELRLIIDRQVRSGSGTAPPLPAPTDNITLLQFAGPTQSRPPASVAALIRRLANLSRSCQRFSDTVRAASSFTRLKLLTVICEMTLLKQTGDSDGHHHTTPAAGGSMVSRLQSGAGTPAKHEPRYRRW